MPLKSLHLFVSCLLATLGAHAQDYFEGQVTYSRTAHTTSALSAKEMEYYLFPGNVLVATIKNGNYYNHAAGHDSWTIAKDKRAYYKFAKLDTLYYIDFNSDTTTLLELKKGAAAFSVLRHPSQSVSLKTYGAEQLFYYATDLRLNPDYDKDNTIGKRNLYARESNGGLLLWKKTTFGSYGYGIDSATAIKPMVVDDHLFDLPNLPQKKLNEKELFVVPSFPGGSKAWVSYMQRNLNAEVGVKYIKLDRKQAEAEVKVMVSFAVEPNGLVSEVAVGSDTKGIHPKIVDEALRVIRESPRWIPGSMLGEKCRIHNFQSVTFQVARE